MIDNIRKVKQELVQIGVVIFFTMIITMSYYFINNVFAAILTILLGIEILIVNKKIFGYVTNMPGLFGGVWFLTIGLSCLQLHQKQVTWEYNTWLYYILTYSIFLGGYCLFEVIKKKEKNENVSLLIDKKLALEFLTSITAICTVFFILEVIIRRQIPALSSDMSSYHNFGVTGLHYFTVLSCFILPISIVCVMLYRKEFTRLDYVKIVSYNIIGILIPILIVSRHLLLMTFVLGTIVAITLNKKYEKYMIILIALVGIVGWFGISSLRKQDDVYLKEAMCIQDDSILSIKNMQIYMYVSCNYDNFNANVGKIEKLSLGTKSLFPIFALTGLKFIIPNIADENLIRFVDVYNTYPIIMQPYQDFGEIGIYIYMMVIGYLCGLVENIKKNKFSNILIDSIFKYCLIFSFFTNGFATPAIWFYVIILILIEKIFFRGKILKMDYKEEKDE